MCNLYLVNLNIQNNKITSRFLQLIIEHWSSCFFFIFAGSDLQSRSICSFTFKSGSSFFPVGTGCKHKGQTGTWAF